VWSTEDYVFLEGKIPRTPFSKNSQKARSFGRHHSDADFEGMGAKPQYALGPSGREDNKKAPRVRGD
jgi:hypothetical protein